MKVLSELPVLVVDCQTTGATPALGAVLEIGWGLAIASHGAVAEPQAHWLALPPGVSVGRQVRRLTGFDEAQVAALASPEQAWHGLRRNTGFAPRFPAAIHFAKFELAFLRDWAARFEPELPFPLDAVCVHAIACRLYPDLPRRSLRALAGHLGHSVALTRRCLGHVEATAFIWHKLVAELSRRGITTWSVLGAWLEAPAPSRSRSQKRRYPLARAAYQALPDQPGVYRFLRSNADILYVGKAASLKKRVASHFSQRSPGERALEMLTQVHEVRATPTATALEAALLENDEIKALAPPYNVQLVGGDRPAWFIDARFEQSAPRPDAQHRLGPLPSTYSVRALGAIQRIAAGEAPTLALCARAVGAAERWAPAEGTFQAGFELFSERYALRGSSRERERALIRAAKQLLLAAKAIATEADAALDAEGTLAGAELEVGGGAIWDAERVLRHLERGLAQAFQHLQRARWLCLLHDSVVVFQEPASAVRRVIVISRGRLGATYTALASERSVAALPFRPRLERQAFFDRAEYDRLRTLTSELKRILRDGAQVQVGIGRRWLEGEPLERLLRWV